MNSRTFELSPERWALVDRLFDEAMRLDATDRLAFLEAQCPDDAALREYLLELLQSDPADNLSIDTMILDTMHQAFGELQSDEMRGERIGPYEVERLLGAGGMGMVYLARRADEQFEQEVAIKLGRHRLVDPRTKIRLRNERQILADLDHPNIARLFDGGTTKDGVPYLVMEFIDGIRIDSYCDLHRLSIEDRLRLFQKICQAVHYAHQNLVIHRDIKAANILVTADGIPKLLDFGIAKLTDPRGFARDGVTRDGAVMLTPANAAPEQILSRPITTATDVYALGLLLYTLLSGYRAYDTDGLSPTEFASLVCSTTAATPSMRLRKALQRGVHPIVVEELESIARNRGTSPERLRRRVHGDLDTIVANTLRKDPNRRYRSVSALGDDIDLHLRSMPIVARAYSWRYRAGKFLRRHYAAVAASLGVFGMLVTFSVVLSIQNRDIVKERDTAREVSQFLEDIFMAQDPAHARGASVTAEEILATGASRIRTDLGSRPEIQVALIETIGRVYFNLGVYDTSAEMLEQALELRREISNDDSRAVAAVQNDLAEALIRVPDYPRAEVLLSEALASNRRNSGPATPDVANNLFNLAELHLKTSEFEEAERYASASIAVYSQFTDDHSIELAESKNMLARILQVRGDLGRTEALLLEAIDIVMRNEGPDHPLMAYYLQNLGVLQRSQGKLGAAEESLRKAIATTKRVFGEKHHLLAATLVNQGTLLHARGDLDGAERVLRDALRLHAETRGASHPMVGFDMTVLGMLLHDQAKFADAENILRQALEIYDAAYNDDHQYTASALTELGAVLNSTGRLVEAEQVLRRAMQIRLRDYQPEHQLVAGTRAEYADTLLQLGRVEDAEAMLEESVAALQDQSGRRRDRANSILERLREQAGRTSQ